MKNILMIPISLIMASLLTMCTNPGKENGQDSTDRQTVSMAEEEAEDRIVNRIPLKAVYLQKRQEA
jgi:hypothetical protein